MTDLALWEAAALVAVGTMAGFINVMAGGGSILTVPAMIFLGVPGPVANGTNRIAILAQNLSAITTFKKSGHSHFRLALSLAACATPGAILGAWMGARLSGDLFNQILAMVMLVVMGIMYTGGSQPTGAFPASTVRNRLGHGLMLLAGFWGGFIQIGMGFLLMPILNRVMGLDLVTTNILKVSIVAVYTAAALAVYASTSEVMWLIGSVLAVGNAFGGYLGASMTLRRGELWIRRLMYVAITLMIVKLLFFS